MKTCSKILSGRNWMAPIRRLQKRGRKVVFTNGTFDILHLGHVTYLEKARSFGDILVVGVNTDRSVKTYKNPGRPINPERDRIRVLVALACVDFAVLFEEPTPLRLIRELKPDVLVKGADWKKSEIAGAREVESWGGAVKRVRLVPGRSTTAVIRGILKSKR
ncbi:MAG: D-glycero-beta-D-manno-heptose 1-phosphate adenylyltransferase [Candidatus Omnitrophota bacterium]